MASRYRFKLNGRGEYDQDSFATRDAAIEFAMKNTKILSTIIADSTVFVIDSMDAPSRIVGAATAGQWRPVIGRCKECAHQYNQLPTGVSTGLPCELCDGFGVQIERMPWKP